MAGRAALYAEYEMEENAYRLREWRTQRGWTQQEAAEATGYSLDTWKSYETGRLTVSPRVLKMMELLGNAERAD